MEATNIQPIIHGAIDTITKKHEETSIPLEYQLLRVQAICKLYEMVKRVRVSEEGKVASAKVLEGVTAGAAAAAAMIAFQEPAFPGMLHKKVLTNNIHFCRCNPNEDDATTWNSRRKSCKVVSPWDSFTFSQKADITTVGFPNTKMHDHPLGLTQVTFDNCVVKVRVGHDLDNLLSLGRLGQVNLTNVSSNGWVATNISLLPCCIFLRWISTMQATGE